MIDLISNRKQS